MKNITTYITEAAKFDYWKDIIEFPGYELKVPKKYIKPVQPKYYRQEFLEKYFGWINQWLDKNIKNIVKTVVKDNKDFPKEILIKLPNNLSGKLRLEFDHVWTDGVPHGSLRNAEIEVNHISSMRGGEFYDAKYDLEQFKLNEPIKY